MAQRPHGGAQLSHVVLKRADLSAAELPHYPGIALADVTLVDSARLASEAFALLRTADALGFDSESKPTFLKGEVSTGPHLIQLASETRAFLFPISSELGRRELKEILESPTLLKVGFGLGNDRSALRARLDIVLSNVLDLGEVLRGPGHRGTVGAKVAVAHFFGQRLQKSKRIGTSNWANPRLLEHQSPDARECRIGVGGSAFCRLVAAFGDDRAGAGQSWSEPVL
jgi:RNA polymerase sigma factor for flagellar operon FliA